MRSSLWLQLRLIYLKYKICESIFSNNILMSMLIYTQHDFPAVSMSAAAKPQSPSSMSAPEWPLCPHGLLPLIYWWLRKILLGQQFLIIHVLTVRKVLACKYRTDMRARKGLRVIYKNILNVFTFFQKLLKTSGLCIIVRNATIFITCSAEYKSTATTMEPLQETKDLYLDIFISYLFEIFFYSIFSECLTI